MARHPRDIYSILKMLMLRIPKNYLEMLKAIIFKKRRKIHKLSPKRVIHESFIKCYSYSDSGKEIYEKRELELLGKKIIISWPPKWETHETGLWSKKMSNKIRYYGNSMDKDIKLIWELHRMQWLPNIANYALKTNNNVLKNELIDIIYEYHLEHPRMYTISWMEGIEISLRSMSILEVLGQIKDIDSEGDKIAAIYSYLADNAQWLNDNLSLKWRLNNNHLILELVGLGILSFVLDWHPKSGIWRMKAKTLLIDELEKQIFSGRNWEPTTAYHRFVCEALIMFNYHLNQKEVYKCEITEKIFEKTKIMTGSLLWLMDNDNYIPLIGDDDAGIVIPRKVRNECRNTTEVIEAMKRINLDTTRKNGTKIWEKHNTGVLKNDMWHIHLTSGAPRGIGKQASHRHLDMMSLTVNLNGKDILKDGGTGLYFSMPEWRDYFREEKVHSGIRSKNKNWGEIRNLFEIMNPCVGEIKVINQGTIVAELETDGKNNPHRKVTMNQEKIIIEDLLFIPEPIITFVLDKGLKISIENGNLLIEGEDFMIIQNPQPKKYIKRSEFLIPSSENKPNEKTSTISKGYGEFEESLIIDLYHEMGSLVETKIIKK